MQRYRYVFFMIGVLLGVNVVALIVDLTTGARLRFVYNDVLIIFVSSSLLYLIKSLWNDALMLTRLKKWYEDVPKREKAVWC